MTSFSAHCCIALVLVGELAGCSAPTPIGKIAGKVTLDGNPLGPVNVMFEGAGTGVNIGAKTDAEGNFKIKTATTDGLPPGTYAVSVQEVYVELPLGPVRPEDAEKFKKLPFPDFYRSGTTSPIKVEIKEGDNNVVVAVKST